MTSKKVEKLAAEAATLRAQQQRALWEGTVKSFNERYVVDERGERAYEVCHNH